MNSIMELDTVRSPELVNFVILNSFCNSHPMGCPSKEEDIKYKKRPRVSTNHIALMALSCQIILHNLM